MSKIILLCCTLQLAIYGAIALNCAPRDYGLGSIVCVCNATYCDNFAPLVKTPSGVITSYRTTLLGERFHKSELHFTKDHFHNAHPQISISIDPATKYQKLIGIGGAFTDSAGFNIASMPKDLQTRIIKDYFATDGLEYSIARVPIGGTDMSLRPYTLHEVPDDDQLTKFELAKEDLEYKIPFMKLAQQVSPFHLKYYATPWSGPSWIKVNHEMNHGGFIIGSPGGRYYKVYARYITKFLTEYAKHNVSYWGIAVLNEPHAGYDKHYGFNSMAMNGTLTRDFVKLDLAPELHAHGFTSDKLKVMIYDDNVHDGHFNVESFATEVLSDPEAAKHVAGTAIHWYVDSNREELTRLHHKFPNFFILSTEACEIRQPQLGRWPAFEKYAINIIRDFNHFSSGWTEWNLALDLKGHPYWMTPNGGLDAPVIVNVTAGEYYKQPIFYAMGHFSKFLPPDSVRLHQIETNHDAANIWVTTFERPDKGTVLIILNRSIQPAELQLHDPRHGNVTVTVKSLSLETLLWY